MNMEKSKHDCDDKDKDLGESQHPGEDEAMKTTFSGNATDKALPVTPEQEFSAYGATIAQPGVSDQPISDEILGDGITIRNDYAQETSLQEQITSGEDEVEFEDPTAANASSAVSSRMSRGDVISGRYEIKEKLGEGGMGVVYKVIDLRNEQVVALKISIEEASSEEDTARFKREISVMSQLRHPNIVGIYDAGRIGNNLYLTMDFVAGAPLNIALARAQRMLPKVAAQIIADIADAVHYTHLQKIVHRDLKPANIMIDGQHKVMLMDFGIAKILESHTRITQSGIALGTPHYMSPEQARGDRDVDGRSDIFALGSMLYELLTGKAPFDGESPRKILQKIVMEEPLKPNLLNQEIDLDLQTICLKAMTKDRERRYQSAQELRDDLCLYLDGKAIGQQQGNPIATALSWIKQNTKLIIIDGAILLFLSLLVSYILGLF